MGATASNSSMRILGGNEQHWDWKADSPQHDSRKQINLWTILFFCHCHCQLNHWPHDLWPWLIRTCNALGTVCDTARKTQTYEPTRQRQFITYLMHQSTKVTALCLMMSGVMLFYIHHHCRILCVRIMSFQSNNFEMVKDLLNGSYVWYETYLYLLRLAIYFKCPSV